MKILKLLIIFAPLITTSFAVEFGDGSDGACNLNIPINTDTKNIYNCSSVIISNITVTGSKPLFINSTSSVTISGIISLNGGLGGSGGLNPLSSTLGIAGPGGFSGGPCTTGLVAGDDGESGGNDGEGKGGTATTWLGLGDSGGSGGGGARFGTAIIPSAGANGEDDVSDAVNGGAAGLSSYAPESGFENIFIGGSGGGAGSAGEEDGVGTHSGGAGGGGGGAIKITAKVDIVIEASGGIYANGGNGGDGSGAVSGGGGGGSGGAIFFQVEGDIKINGTVSAVGGDGGDGTFFTDNNGGDGGSGRIRYDDLDGVITGTGTTTPTAVVNTISVSNSTTIQAANYDSSIACGSIGLTDKDKPLYSLVFIFSIFLIGNIISKKSQYI